MKFIAVLATLLKLSSFNCSNFIQLIWIYGLNIDEVYHIVDNIA